MLKLCQNCDVPLKKRKEKERKKRRKTESSEVQAGSWSLRRVVMSYFKALPLPGLSCPSEREEKRGGRIHPPSATADN